MLAKAYIRPDDLHWLPFAMYVDEVLVGLVELAWDPASQSNYWMYHFFIDAAHQGKGYGKQCLLAFVDSVRATYPNCEQLYLTVNSANLVAQRLYASVGFQPSGEFLHDEPVYMLRVR
jgi:diamine N-acetyltransferase